MEVNEKAYLEIKRKLDEAKVTLVAVSKKKSLTAIQELYALGQRDFAENYVQELLEKQELLPKDIRWHFIGHLQTNKVKLVIPHVYLIHSVDSKKLFDELQKEGRKQNREVNVLLQVHIAKEETKYGFSEPELAKFFENEEMSTTSSPIHILGFMGMASLTQDENQIKKEFLTVSDLSKKYGNSLSSQNQEPILSMGMSSDYEIAIEAGTTMVRLGSVIFGARK